MTTVLSRRDALAGLSVAAGAAAFGANAFAKGKDGIVTWNVNNLTAIGGHPAFVIGEPKLINTPAGKAVEFDGKSGLILETNPMAGYQQWTMETLVRPDGGKDTAASIPGAKLLMVEGMGHALPMRFWPQIVVAIDKHAHGAAAQAA